RRSGLVRLREGGREALTSAATRAWCRHRSPLFVTRPSMTAIIGVISDTHGLLRPAAKSALAGCDLIVHAGDIGKPHVLEELAEIAPVTAIRGNVDAWTEELPDNDVVEIEGRYLYVLHNIELLDLDPRAAGFDAVIFGHSHVPAVYTRA